MSDKIVWVFWVSVLWSRKIYRMLVALLKPGDFGQPPPLLTLVEPETIPPAEEEASPVIDETIVIASGLVPPPSDIELPNRRAKWAKPKGQKPKSDTPKAEHVPRPASPPRPKAARPKLHNSDDPEQWGQFYFRDAILDQLDVYFVYLKRMQHNDRDAYNLHRQLGIHILPRSAVQAFDDWRHDNDAEQLTAWWKSHRPGFGAVSYGIDADTLHSDDLLIADLSPEQWDQAIEQGDAEPTPEDDTLPHHRISTVFGGHHTKLGDQTVRASRFWTPRFLYFRKWKVVPAEIERVSEGDVYSMTIYWDRVKGLSKTYHKRHKGGVPQDYAICVDRTTGKLRLLRALHVDYIEMRSKRRHGDRYSIPSKRWQYPAEYLDWACGRLDESPEDFLCRVFMEAALMYESASLGSMIRVNVSKNRGHLSATFGVEIKRTAYFFKDRDVVLNDKGQTARIFHIVRPHVRKNGSVVPMHFRGLKEFNWAGYKVSITVPGIDHLHLTDFDLGMGVDASTKRETIGATELGKRLRDNINQGSGAWKQHNATKN